MIKFILGLGVLFSLSFAHAEVLILKNETYCGVAKMLPLNAVGQKENYHTALLVDKPTATFTQDVLEQLKAADQKLIVWFTIYTFDKKEESAKMEANKCYCVRGDAGGDIGLMGFQEIFEVKETACSVE